jgi:hypothetical protein
MNEDCITPPNSWSEGMLGSFVPTLGKGRSVVRYLDFRSAPWYVCSSIRMMMMMEETTLVAVCFIGFFRTRKRNEQHGRNAALPRDGRELEKIQSVTDRSPVLSSQTNLGNHNEKNVSFRFNSIPPPDVVCVQGYIIIFIPFSHPVPLVSSKITGSWKVSGRNWRRSKCVRV